jgi:phosphonate transport system ATP-binding protein
MELLAAIAVERHVPVVINIHNVSLAKRFAQRIVGMSKGAIVFDGAPEKLAEAHLNEIYGGEDWHA